MKIENIINEINKRQKGSIVRVKWQTEIQKKNSPVTVLKVTESSVRFGVRYSHVGKVQAKRREQEANGKTITPKTPWWRWSDTHPNTLKVNLKDESKKYITLFWLPHGNNTKTKYYINGVEATKQEVMDSGYVNPSYWTSHNEEPITFDVSVDNIISFGNAK